MFDASIQGSQKSRTGDQNAKAVSEFEGVLGRPMERQQPAEKASVLQLEASHLLGKDSTFRNTVAVDQKSQNPEVSKMLGNTEISGTVLASDKQFSMKATAAADAKVFGTTNDTAHENAHAHAASKRSNAA